MFQIALQRRVGPQALNGIPALGDGLVSLADGPVERADGLFGAPGEQVARRLEREHQPLKALQQRVVQFAGDARPLVDALLQAHVEFLLELPDTELVGRPQQCQKNGRAKGSKPIGPPPGGRDENGQRHPFFIPYAIAVRSLHAKNIFAGV